jgi:uncharacterized protein (TIGR03067 family)
MRRGLVLAVAAVLLAAAPGGRAAGGLDDDRPDPDLKKLQGKWEIIYHETAGVEDTEQNRWTMEVKGDRYVLTSDGQTFTGRIRFDSSKKPRHLDYTVGEDEDVEEYNGIYELAADEYRTCDVAKGKERPTEFKTKDPTGQVSKWKRVKVKD